MEFRARYFFTFFLRTALSLLILVFPLTLSFAPLRLLVLPKIDVALLALLKRTPSFSSAPRAFFLANLRAKRSGSDDLYAFLSSLDKDLRRSPSFGSPLGIKSVSGCLGFRRWRFVLSPEEGSRTAFWGLEIPGRVLQRCILSFRFANLTESSSSARISSTESISYEHKQ